MKMISKKISLITVFIVLFAGSIWFVNDWNHYWQQKKTLHINEFVIKEGLSGNTIIAKLQQQGIIDSRFYLKLWLKFNQKNDSFKQGTYSFAGALSLDDIVRKLINGEEKLFETTIIPGWTIEQTLLHLKNNKHLDNDIENRNLAKILNLQGATEGWLFPDSYHFPNGYKISKLLLQSHQKMEQILNQAWNNRSPLVQLKNKYQMLILASIVEKETALRSEKPLIAGLFLLRLQKHMRLQTDPTVIYGMGNRFQGNITRKDLLSDNPYNTYTRFGLTPTPIALPDEDSILAVSQPIISDKLYFVADGSGGHSFSSTLEEHNKKVRKFLLHKKKK